jgi:hypothetical protein
MRFQPFPIQKKCKEKKYIVLVILMRLTTPQTNTSMHKAHKASCHLYATAYLLQRYKTPPFERIRTVKQIFKTAKKQKEVLRTLQNRAGHELSETIKAFAPNCDFTFTWNKESQVCVHFSKCTDVRKIVRNFQDAAEDTYLEGDAIIEGKFEFAFDDFVLLHGQTEHLFPTFWHS